jgi:heparin/heparan-sulfate lyase
MERYQFYLPTELKKVYKIIPLVLLLTIHFSLYSQTLTRVPDVPMEHPRVLIKKSELSSLKEKRLLPEFTIIWNQINNSSQPICQALSYLLEGNESKGRAAINGAYESLKGTTSNGLRLMNEVFLASCVYDWCYDLMSSTQKQNYISEFKRIHNLHPPYWPAKSGFGTIVSHNTSGWFFNQLFAGLAIYDEDPTPWNSASRIFFDEFQDVRNFAIKSHMSHQGWYVSTRWSHMVLTGFLFNKISGGKDVWVDDFEQTGLMLAYFMRSDGQIMRLGDTKSDSWEWEFHNVFLDNLANYYNNPYLAELAQHRTFKSYNSTRDDLFGKFLLRPVGIKYKSLDDLPKTKYFHEPVGPEMIARTGWSVNNRIADEAVINMRIGQYYFGGHQHKDFGTFQIYYKGNLTGDSGMYGGSSSNFSSNHWKHYYRSTTAHNGLLIYNPAEKYSGGSWTNTIVDGGQRWPTNNDVQPDNYNVLLNPLNGYQYGELISKEVGPNLLNPEFSYISGDLTKGYVYPNNANPDKVSTVTRSMVTFNTGNKDYPAVFFVFDRIISTNENFKKTFLLHGMSKPQVNGRKTVLNSKNDYDGKLVSYTLLPEKFVINEVEGYKIFSNSYNPGTKNDGSYEDMRYRVEISPSVPSKEDHFLHTMVVMDKTQSEEPVAEKLINGDLIGAKMLDRIAFFSKSGELLSHANIILEGNEELKVLLCDLVPGRWVIENNGNILKICDVKPKSNTVYFETNPGNLNIYLQSSNQIADKE